MKWWRRLAASRPPNFIIQDGAVHRWWVIPRNRFANIYLHHFLKSDPHETLHDHPWFNISYLLEGEYTEELIQDGGVHTRTVYRAGNIRFRRAATAHRIEIDQPCWSLFISGPQVREWGFHCPNGWRPWNEFLQPYDRSSSGSNSRIGRGCD